MSMTFFQQNKRYILAGSLVLLAMISYFLLADSSWLKDLNASLVASLDSKKNTVAALAATSVATSTSISLLPNDIGSPVAENLADLTNYLVVVLGAIWLQKYLVGLAGALLFKVMLPIASLILAGNIFLQKDALQKLATKLLLFGALVFILVPTSVGVSNHIETTYKTSIEQTIEDAKEDNSTIQNDAAENESWWSKVTSFLSNAYESTMNKVQTIVGNLLDAIAVLIVTTCVIPILVFVFFMWGVKLIFGLDISLPSFKTFSVRRKKN